MYTKILWGLLLISFLGTSAFGDCFQDAGRIYGINPVLLRAIAKTESGLDPLALHKNSNGSYDYGMMQINSCWRSSLGDDRWQHLSDPEYNVMVGAWVLKQCMQRYGYSWDAVACYNTGKGLSDGNSRQHKQAIRYISEVWKEIQSVSLQGDFH